MKLGTFLAIRAHASDARSGIKPDPIPASARFALVTGSLAEGLLSLFRIPFRRCSASDRARCAKVATAGALILLSVTAHAQPVTGDPNHVFKHIPKSKIAPNQPAWYIGCLAIDDQLAEYYTTTFNSKVNGDYARRGYERIVNPASPYFIHKDETAEAVMTFANIQTNSEREALRWLSENQVYRAVLFASQQDWLDRRETETYTAQSSRLQKEKSLCIAHHLSAGTNRSRR